MSRCPACTRENPYTARFCGNCGAKLPAARQHTGRDRDTSTGVSQEMIESGQVLVWENKVRFIDMVILRGMVLLITVSLGVLFLILLITFLLTGNDLMDVLSGLGLLLLIAGGIMAILMVVSVVILHMATGGGYDATFVVSPDGVGFFGGTAMKKVNTGLLVLGALSRSPQALGASLINYGSEENRIRWEDVRSVKVHPDERYILVRPRWLVYPLPLYCTDGNFGVVLDLIRKYRPDLMTRT